MHWIQSAMLLIQILPPRIPQRKTKEFPLNNFGLILLYKPVSSSDCIPCSVRVYVILCFHYASILCEITLGFSEIFSSCKIARPVIHYSSEFQRSIKQCRRKKKVYNNEKCFSPLPSIWLTMSLPCLHCGLWSNSWAACLNLNPPMCLTTAHKQLCHLQTTPPSFPTAHCLFKRHIQLLHLLPKPSWALSH